MKKHNLTKMSVLVLILTTLISVFAISVNAADPSAGLSSNRASVKRGQEFTVSIKLNQATNVRSLGIEFDFDTSVFESLNMTKENSGWKVASPLGANYNVLNKQAGVGFLSPTNIDGEIFVLTLKVKENANLGNQTISAFVRVTNSIGEVNDYQAGNISVNVECNHSGGTATCTEKKTCSLCGEKYGDFAHTYNREVAEERYLKSPANCTDAAIYYKSCACGEKGTSTFVYGTSADHVFTENVDDTYLKTPATCTAKAVYAKSCPGCGLEGTKTFEAGEMLAHSYGSEWQKDENGHWNECSCGAKGNAEGHAWDEGLVTKGATESEEGIMTYTCMKCYEKKTTSIDKLVPPASQPTTESDATIWIVICVVEAIAIVVLVVVILLKKPIFSTPVEKQVDEKENDNADKTDETKNQENGDDINTSEE